MTSIKLRIVIGSLGLGGTENHLCQILPELTKRGFKIKVITLSDHIPLSKKLIDTGVSVNYPRFKLFKKPVLLRRSIRLITNIFRLWWDFLIDRKSITHFFLPEAYVLGTISKLLAFNFAPALMSRRSMNYYQKKYYLLAIFEKFCHGRMDTVLGNSRAVIKQLKEEGVPKGKLQLIYNGINLSPFFKESNKKDLRKKLYLDADALTFAIIANLIPYKGHEDLLNAFALADLNQHWKLLIIGEDRGIKTELETISEKLDLSQHIKWLGQIKNPCEYLLASDVGMLVSHEEGFSNSILECMAAKLPMIVTDVGGNKEAVIDGCGFVVSAKNPKALAKVIKEISSSVEIREKIGKNCHKRIKKNFTLDRCVDEYEKLYRVIN